MKLVTTQAAAAVDRKPSARYCLKCNMVRLRKAKGWSQIDLAAEAGLDRTFIAHVESERRNISLDNIERIAKALSVEVADLLTPVK